ncbi:MAG: response regulator transcription factor [Phycisphaerales bacterium]
MDAFEEKLLRVLCIDDNAMVADALRRRIGHENGLEWVGVVAGGADIFERVVAANPDIVMMDIDIPGVDIFTVLERLTAECASMRILMFSGYVSASLVERALDCGAWGYLSKNDDVSAVIEGIRRAGKGELALSREAIAARQARQSQGK